MEPGSHLKIPEGERFHAPGRERAVVNVPVERGQGLGTCVSGGTKGTRWVEKGNLFSSATGAHREEELKPGAAMVVLRGGVGSGCFSGKSVQG